MKMEPRVPYGYYRHLFSQTDVDNSLYGYVKSDMEEHRLSYALSGNWQRSDPRLGIGRTIVDNPEFA